MGNDHIFRNARMLVLLFYPSVKKIKETTISSSKSLLKIEGNYNLRTVKLPQAAQFTQLSYTHLFQKYG